jgi:ribosome-associated heat shock protein Hsp15
MQQMALRVDKWLWYARFFKSRSLAAKHVQAGYVRVNRQRVTKASAVLKVGDVLTFAQGDVIRIVEVVDLGERRGPAPEARGLYHDLALPQGTAPMETEGHRAVAAAE